MDKLSDRAVGVPHLLAALFFLYAANQLYTHGPSPLNWLGYVVEGIGLLLIARSGQAAIRELWRIPSGRIGVSLMLTGAILTFFSIH